jgi:AcrR family transcriptional regulator
MAKRRRYSMDRRAAAREATRERIVRATVKLHAAKGGATTYGMIAERAGVALQTVHNHFPDPRLLTQACMGLAGASAPTFGTEILDGLSTAAERLAALARALFRQHSYYEPWMRWSVHEIHSDPEVGAMMAAERQKLDEFLRLATDATGRPISPSRRALMATLLDYQGWALFKELHPADENERLRAVVDALTALLDEPGDSSPARSQASTRRKD